MLYVALTRARNCLYVSGGYSSQKEDTPLPSKEKAEYCSQLIMAGMGERNYISVYTPEEIALPSAIRSGSEVVPSAEIAAAGSEERPVKSEADLVREAMGYVYPHLSATKTGIKFTVTGINEMKEEKVLPATRFFPVEAAAKGTAYHVVMEYAPFSMESVDEARALLRSLVERKVVTEEEANDISPRRFFEGVRKVSEVVGDRRVYREKSFLLHISAKEAGVAPIEDEIEVQGQLDLLAIGSEDAVIVDYKLSAHTREELIETYRKQLSLYENAVRKSFGMDRIRKYIFVLGRNELIEV